MEEKKNVKVSLAKIIFWVAVILIATITINYWIFVLRTKDEKNNNEVQNVTYQAKSVVSHI